MRSVPGSIAPRAAAAWRSAATRFVAGRPVAVALAALTLASCSAAGPGGAGPSATPSPTPTPTPVTLTVASGTVPLRVRHVPATAGNELARIPSGSTITVDCSVAGDSVTGTQGSTSAWHHVLFQGRSGFVSAAYVSGGQGATIPDCPVVPAVATTPRPAPTASVGSDPGAAVIARARSQAGVAEKGTNCNAYAKACEEWCGHFASWVWRGAGVEVPVFPFTGDFYSWGQGNGRTRDGVAGVAPGDLVLYGTGPKTVKTSTHVDIVVEVHPDHLRVIGGNVSDRVTERDVPLTGIYAHVAVRG